MRNYVEEFILKLGLRLRIMSIVQILEAFFDFVWKECVAPEQRNAAHWRERAESAEAEVDRLKNARLDYLAPYKDTITAQSSVLAQAREVLVELQDYASHADNCDHWDGDGDCLCGYKVCLEMSKEVIAAIDAQSEPKVAEPWIPVTERMPETRDIVWIYDTEYGVDRARKPYEGENDWTGDDDRYDPTSYFHVTHWKPYHKPGPPAGEGAKE